MISGHALLALCGLILWVSYLITGEEVLAQATLLVLALVVSLGVTMAVRWAKVRRAKPDPLVPPERHFPLPVVIGHGVFAATTVVLVVLTTFGVGGA